METCQICNQFWELCSDFKNKTNMNTDYMEYISALLYLRYYDNGRGRNFQELYKEKENFYINTKIDDAINKMRQRVRDEKLFSDIQFKNIVFYRKLGERNILTVAIDQIDILSKKYSKMDMAKAYEFAIKQSAIHGDIKRTEEIFYTPEEIVNIMVKMLVEKENAKVYDPVYGSGNFLMKAIEQRNAEIFGKEENIEYYSIFKTRILLNETENKEISKQETIKIENMKFDYGLLNPPFSQRNWREGIEDTAIFEEYGLSENAVGDYAYVLRTLGKLKDNGKMAVVLPHGVLFRENEKKVRQTLIEKNEMEAIIGLPENLFYDTRIPVIILILAKGRKKDTVLFIDASNEFKSEKSNNVLTNEYQNKIINVYQNSKEIEGYSRVVNRKEIKENDFNLSIKKYIRKKRERKNIEEPKLMKQLKDLENEKDILEENIKDILTVLQVESFQEEKVEKRKDRNIKYELDDKRIGKNIREARIRMGYTQEVLAEWLDLSVKYVSMIERGMTGMRLKLLVRICNVLGVSLEEIVK